MAEALRDEIVNGRDDFDAKPQTPSLRGESYTCVDKRYSRGDRMRLLDRVSSSREPFVLVPHRPGATPIEVAGPSRFASSIAACPLRFVLGDDLTRACAELAFADGARLAGCLDLLRVPARQMWIEWNDEVHKRVMYETRSIMDHDAASSGRRVGVFLEGSSDGYAAVMRTFWSDAGVNETREPTLSPIETHFDLRGELADPSDISAVLSGGFAGIDHDADAAMNNLLNHVRFRFDDTWAAYYRAAAGEFGAQREVVLASLAAVARDAPLILAFLLLLSAKDATRSIPVSRATLNRKRQAHGHWPLLDHIEVHASLDAVQAAGSEAFETIGRQSPRLHHVRGHLVRREDRVFWRVPHLRGSAARGMVRSRTVCLSFVRPRAGDRAANSGAAQRI
jgi:hypothetical protein